MIWTSQWRKETCECSGELESRGYVLIENSRLGKLEFKHREKGDIDVYTREVSGISFEPLLRRPSRATIEGMLAELSRLRIRCC